MYLLLLLVLNILLVGIIKHTIQTEYKQTVYMYSTSTLDTKIRQMMEQTVIIIHSVSANIYSVSASFSVYN